MPRRSISVRATMPLAVVLTILTTSNVASANPCETGNNAIMNEMVKVAEARGEMEKELERVKRHVDEIDQVNKEIELLRNEMQEKKCGFADAPNDGIGGCRDLSRKIEQGKKLIAEIESKLKKLGPVSPAQQAWENAQRRMTNLVKRVAEECTGEARERWERERRARAPAPALSGAATCADGKARIEAAKAEVAAARQSSDAARVSSAQMNLNSLLTIVPRVCEREADAAREAARPAVEAVDKLAQDEASCTKSQANVAEMQGIVKSLREAGDMPRLRSAMENLNIAEAAAKTDCDRAVREAASGPVAIPSCKVGQQRIVELKYKIEAARQSGKAFNYGDSPAAMTGLLAAVGEACERERVAGSPSGPARTCAEEKDILTNFKATVETACKSDPVWCRQSQETLRGVMARASETCERERVASAPSKPRERATKKKRQPKPVYVRRQPRTGPSDAERAAAAAAATAVAIGIIGIMGRSPRGPGYQPQRVAPGCHMGPDGRLHCGRN